MFLSVRELNRKIIVWTSITSDTEKHIFLFINFLFSFTNFFMVQSQPQSEIEIS
jgi:hypothetical protein